MSRFVVALSLAVLLSASFDLRAQSEEARVGETLDALHASAAQADAERYFSLFAEDAVFVGTDAGERWTLSAFREYAMPHFEAGRGWAYRPRERHVTVGGEGRTAWFDELLDNDKYGLARGTGVLVKRNSEWRIVQYALTFPVPNEIAGDLTERIKEWRAGRDE